MKTLNRKGSNSSKSLKMTEATCTFAKLEVTTATSTDNSNIKTVLLEGDKACIQFDKKELYVGPAYKVKWSTVTRLEVHETNNDEYGEPQCCCTLEYTTTSHGSSAFGNKNNETKTTVVQAYQQRSSSSNPNQSWVNCERLLKKFWNKQCYKRDQQLLRKEEEAAAATANRRGGGGNRGPHHARRGTAASASRSTSKAARFLMKNQANMKLWDEEDEEEDKKTFHRYKDRPTAATRDYEEKGDEVDDETHGDPDRFQDPSTATTGDDDVSMTIGQEGSNDDDAVEEDPSPVTTATAQKTLRKKTLQGKRKRRIIDSDDEDEAMFGMENDDGMTTPKSNVKRIVSPTASAFGSKSSSTVTAPTKKTSKFFHSAHSKQRVFLDDDDDDLEDRNMDEEVVTPDVSLPKKAKSEEVNEEEATPDDTADMPKISSFFAKCPAKSGTSSTGTSSKRLNKNTAQNPKKKSAAPRKEPHTQSDDEESPPTSVLPRPTKAKAPPADFFAPRKQQDQTDCPFSPKTPRCYHRDGDETPTVCPTTPNTQSSSLLTMTPNNSSSKRRRRTPFGNDLAHSLAYESAKKLEEADPLIDPPDTPTRLTARANPRASPLFRPALTSRTPRLKATKKRLWGKTYSKRPTFKVPPSSIDAALDDSFSPTRKSQPMRTFTALKTTNPYTRKDPPCSPTSDEEEEPVPLFRGLGNLGNTCYMNASLQMLFSVPAFAQALEQRNKKNSIRLSCTLGKLWKSLRLRHPRSATARFLKSAIDELTDKFRGFQQRDAHEFLGDLLDRIHEQEEEHETKITESSPGESGEEEETKEEEPGSPALSSCLPTDEFFRLDLDVCLKCHTCGYTRTKQEMYRYLSVDIPDGESPSVKNCLEHFFKPQDLEIKCEKCEEGTKATQTLRVLSRPKALLLHLKRFVLVENTVVSESNDDPPKVEMSFRKNKGAVQLSEGVNLSPYLSEKEEKKDDDALAAVAGKQEYALQSIVHHIGSSANKGHYTADAIRKHPETNESTWVTFDDSIMHETSASEVMASARNQQSAYMLMYTST